jgi:hypothetical protein
MLAAGSGGAMRTRELSDGLLDAEASFRRYLDQGREGELARPLRSLEHRHRLAQGYMPQRLVVDRAESHPALDPALLGDRIRIDARYVHRVPGRPRALLLLRVERRQRDAETSCLKRA